MEEVTTPLWKRALATIGEAIVAAAKQIWAAGAAVVAWIRGEHWTAQTVVVPVKYMALGAVFLTIATVLIVPGVIAAKYAERYAKPYIPAADTPAPLTAADVASIFAETPVKCIANERVTNTVKATAKTRK